MTSLDSDDADTMNLEANRSGMSSSCLPTPVEVPSPSQSAELNTTAAASGTVSSDSVSPKVVHEGPFTTSDAPASTSSQPNVTVPVSPAGPPPPRFPGNIATQEPRRSSFLQNPGYTVPAGFSYNVYPRINPPPGGPQQPPTVPALNLNNRMPPAALQPPVPGQPIANRPSFSYNIAQANAIHAPGQQFPPATAPSQTLTLASQGQIRPSQTSTPSSHSSSLVQPSAFNPNVTRTVMENPSASSELSSLAKGQPSTPGFSIGGSSQSSTAEQEAPTTAAILGSSQNITAPPAQPQSGQPCTSTSLGSSPVIAASANSNHVSLSVPTGPAFSRPPGALCYPGMFIPNTLPASGLPSSIVSVRPPPPTPPESSNIPPKVVMPSPAPSNPHSFQTPVIHSVPSQMNQHHLPYPAAAPPHLPWLPPQVGAMQHPPFFPYPGPAVAPYPLPMRGIPPITALHPPGVPIIAAPVVSPPVAQGSVTISSISTMKSPATANDNHPSNLVHDGASKKIDEDVWTAHKTDTGVTYYYNSVTGESTYEKPANFKADKVTAQPTPISCEKLPGTDWALVTTDDGKKYYYDTKNKVSSWQIPQEVADILKNQEDTTMITAESPSQNADKISSTNVNSATITAGGRDVGVPKNSGGTISSSALDLIKKKLQEASAPLSSSSVPVSSTLSEGSKTVESSTQESDNNKEKPKDANGDANMSESSSDSEDTDGGPSKEECIIQFKEMLKERGVAPFSKWEKELPKIVFDPRFKAVPGYADRRSLFEHYVRTRADEERKEKKAAQKAAIEAFKCLLEEASEDIDIKTDYSVLKRKWGSDPRFVALDRKEKELLLQEKLLSLKKAAEETRLAAATKFKSMLRERRDITATTRWSRVKDSLRNDPRYRVVNHEDREVLFNQYLLELKTAEEDVEKAEKAKREEQEKLKRREQETRKRKQREEQEMESLRLKVRRKEAEASFQALLVETIKDPKASWTESKPKLEKDPQGRFTNSGLELADMEKLFREHVKLLFERCINDFKTLLNDIITMEAASKANDSGKSILTSWSEAKALLKPDARYAKLPSKEKESLWCKHADELLRKQKGTSTRLDSEGRGKSSSEQAARPSGSHRRR